MFTCVCTTISPIHNASTALSGSPSASIYESLRVELQEVARFASLFLVSPQIINFITFPIWEIVGVVLARFGGT
jgi:hypothetical protein